ncbi:MAG: hypothetical protein OQL20_12005 [Sedimenticola sp.]|nr:hypothetical protein [Sedimenticola sp.]
MGNSVYRITDEPAPGAMSALVVNPLWPFIAVMFGGVWLSWSWFALNGVAVGSPSKNKEWMLIAGGLLGAVMLMLGLMYLADSGLVEQVYLKYLFLILVVWKLGITYALYALQSHTIELYEYYGGTIKNGVLVVVASFFVSPMILSSLPYYAQLLLR